MIYITSIYHHKKIKERRKKHECRRNIIFNSQTMVHPRRYYEVRTSRKKFCTKKIKEKLEKKGYLIPKSVVPTKEVVAFFDIDIPYLESRVSSKDLIKKM